MAENYLRTVWSTIHEPRFVTALTILAYVATAALGLVILLGIPAEATASGLIIRGISGGLLVFSGFIGTPMAWTGTQWVERGAALAMVGGYTSWAMHLLGAHFADHYPFQLSAPTTTTTSMLIVAVFALTRFYRLRENPYAQGKGPLLPEEEAKLAALTLTETH